MPAAGADEVAQQFSIGARLTAGWWQLFDSKPLNAVLALALSGSPTLESARYNLSAARESLTGARGVYYPQVDLGAGTERGGQNIGSTTTTGNLFSIGTSANYSVDLFGGDRRRVDQQAALMDFQRSQLGAAYLALTGNAVLQVIDIASATEQLKAIEEILAVDQRNLELVRVSAAAGKSAQLEVLTAESQLASDRTLLPTLHQQLEVAQYALAVLTGNTPAEWTPPAFDFDSLALPRTLPISVPSELVRARPDISSSEAQLHATNAAVGIATSNLYPILSLTGSWSYAASDTNSFLNPANAIWKAAAGLTAPLFHGRALQAQKRAAVAIYNSQLAMYRQTLLQAFGQVAILLRALEHDAESMAAEQKALETARASLELTQQSYQAGQSSFLQLLEAQRLYQQARLGYVRAKSQRYIDTAQLFVAMGGGWIEGVKSAQ